MRKGTVTADQRKQAARATADKAKLLRIGLAAVQQIGFRAQRVAYKEFKAGRDPGVVVARIIRKEFLPVLTQSMVAAHVSGSRRSVLNTPKGLTLSLAGDPFAEAVESLNKWAAVTNAQMDALANTYGTDAIMVTEGFTNHANRKLMKVVGATISEGLHIAEAKMRLMTAFEELGMMPGNSFTLEGIFRTESAKAYSSGAFAMEQDSAIQEALWGYRYVTVGDNRVRDNHAGFDGVTLPKDNSFWDVNRPPNGWACRCECIPLFDELKQSKPRPVDMDGEMVTPQADSGFGVHFGKVMTA